MKNVRGRAKTHKRRRWGGMGGIVREGRVSAVLFVEEERMNEYEVG